MNYPAAPHRLNVLFGASVIALALVQFGAVPLLLLPHAPLWAGAAVVLISLATPFSSAVLHEAIHGRLGSSAGQNDLFGRALAICSGVSFDAVRFAHLSHHRFNRHALDRPDVIEPGMSPLAAGIRYYAHLFGGLYAGEILASVAMLLPRRAVEFLLDRAMASEEPSMAKVRSAAQRVLERRLRRLRIDALLAILLYAGAFYLYGEWWPLLLAGISVRGVIVSLQDNLPHYGTPAVINTDAHNSRAPRWLTKFMLNQNLHAVHHDRPELYWNALPAAFASAGRKYTGNYLTLLVRQFNGPRRPRAAQGAE